jgi:hypothetical protein
VADVVISAERSWTRPTAIRQTTWEMQSPIEGVAYLWQSVYRKGGRDEGSAPGCRQMSMVVLVNPVDKYISVVEEPAAEKSY